MAACLTTNLVPESAILPGNMEKDFNTKFSFKYSCMESRFIKPPQDANESVEVIGKQKMNCWQSENYKGLLLRWSRG